MIIHFVENVMNYPNRFRKLLNVLRHILGDSAVSEMEKQNRN